jgi:hypothetical protein
MKDSSHIEATSAAASEAISTSGAPIHSHATEKNLQESGLATGSNLEKRFAATGFEFSSLRIKGKDDALKLHGMVNEWYNTLIDEI